MSTVGFQPVIPPFSETKMNRAGPLFEPDDTTKSLVALFSWPVGAPPVMWTTVGVAVTGLPFTAPRYVVATSVPLSATQSGVVGPVARPHELTRFGSRSCATPA